MCSRIATRRCGPDSGFKFAIAQTLVDWGFSLDEIVPELDRLGPPVPDLISMALEGEEFWEVAGYAFFDWSDGLANGPRRASAGLAEDKLESFTFSRFTFDPYKKRVLLEGTLSRPLPAGQPVLLEELFSDARLVFFGVAEFRLCPAAGGGCATRESDSEWLRAARPLHPDLANALHHYRIPQEGLWLEVLAVSHFLELQPQRETHAGRGWVIHVPRS